MPWSHARRTCRYVDTLKAADANSKIDSHTSKFLVVFAPFLIFPQRKPCLFSHGQRRSAGVRPQDGQAEVGCRSAPGRLGEQQFQVFGAQVTEQAVVRTDDSGGQITCARRHSFQ
jgi:hypothetical protein